MSEHEHTVTAPDDEAMERVRRAREALMKGKGITPVDPTSDSVQVACGQWTHFQNG